ncbi:hypothetical protein [Candidatus Williamhamiltonella defendens]|uniref:Uncharacterized protein n=1 Tax=Candidatus Hamiltonella defensa (Bemisia tabaci) TaxID=672795 RepID=A0A249DX43_9ENTR|nr:hypothetical protein [Candidatus Hamiltonella defensa]ASX26114.1 hypothetical protein BA171_03120 [Candidatus Hamiltonella defensa (Bemisia tabaci)]CED78224.1 Putative uncharacterized protein P49 [Candidatus Hamiltonella defensa (Bemisia tabaci)]
MKLDNMTEVLTLTHPSNNNRYLLNLAQPVFADEETKTLINIIQLLTEENQHLRKENRRLAKSHR